MKTPTQYGSENEETSFIRRIAAPDRAHGNRKQKKRMAVVGATVGLIAASAVVGYAALNQGGVSEGNVQTEQLEAKADASAQYVTPLDDSFYPSMAQVDTNKDGIMSQTEFLIFMKEKLESDIEKVMKSDLVDEIKENFISQLKANYEVDGPCAVRAFTRPEPTYAPEPEPTYAPEPEPTYAPEPEPTYAPEPEPTYAPEPEPTYAPEPEPTYAPEPEPTYAPEPEPTYAPEPEPTYAPEPEPTYAPEPEPTYAPEPEPTYAPEPEPTYAPEPEPTYAPHPEPEPTYEPEPTFSPVTYGPTPSDGDDTVKIIKDLGGYDDEDEGDDEEHDDKKWMTKEEFRQKLADYFQKESDYLNDVAEKAKAEYDALTGKIKRLDDCIFRAANKFGWYGVYEQPPHFEHAVDWVANVCMKEEN
ncbi:hypothetical protein P43SY_004712 [Pythium insidiosum]|uniref:EF-hand domain-containing protein n=1 Tax=Pythium insidiosum TaxID=114742 RepID=A0AAD5LCR3_PYTIN|nr:hypothetical protein P43SY_004712 [Pythium insidiosum]